ncbi:hypothetical protein ECDEC13A_3022 [Escherichia coli DEC13A]|nr:hypothetical protein ECDEC13A_3022 [Escherichia coli DEC13A]
MFPAPAGINRNPDNWQSANKRVPRASGDKPGVELFFVSDLSCSPRQRG